MAFSVSSKTLLPSSVFVRIRPTATDGSGGHTAGEAQTKEGLAKSVKSWDETAVTVQDNDRAEDATFLVTGVIPPECQQQEAFDSMLPELLSAFSSDSNVLFFAYGQTGSGKTHTMLGEVESLASPSPVPGWGIFPRVVHSTLETMRVRRAEGVKSVLMASAVEFYCGACFDLNSDPSCKTEVTIDRDATLFGTRSKELRSTKQLRKWIMRMYSNRTTAKTKMNDASSRSHCAFILTLHQLAADNIYTRTTFSLIDMAGSERHAKTGGVRLTPHEVRAEMEQMMEAGTPEKLSISAQGYMINLELSFIATEVLKASEAHKKGIPYRAQKESSTAASFYFQACCDGRARLGACVTISQAPQHGYESWFSLRYAQQLASYRGPVVRVVPVPIDKALEDAAKAAEDAAARFANWGDDPKPSGAKQWRVLCLQSGAATHTAEVLEILQRLVDDRDGKIGPEELDAEGDDGSDGDWPPPPPTRPKKAVAKVLKKSALEMGRVNETFSVFIRIRPFLARETATGATSCFAISDIDGFATSPPPQRITVTEGASVIKTFVFDRVLDESLGQQAVYEATAKRYVVEFLGCTNVTIFAYGQTGTGKTHTVEGPSEDPGIVARCLSEIFAGLPESGKELHFEYVQLYMGNLTDLLVSERGPGLKIVERKDGTVYVKNLSSFRATSADQVLSALADGSKRRATRAQDMNSVSSRSHAILMLRLVEPGEEPEAAVASMFVVDLAGSERISRSNVTGQGFDEATAINQSLSSLGRVVTTLVENKGSGNFVPYNGDPLTMVLKVGLGGNSRTALIACVTPAVDSLSESVNTLRFAMQASHVKNKVDKNQAKLKEAQEMDKIREAGAALVLGPDGKGRAGPLACGELEVLGNVSAGSDAALVLIICGYGADPTVWAPLGAQMQAAGLRWLAPTFPGHRGSTGSKCTGNPQEVISTNSGPDVIAQLLDWMGLAKVHIVAIDWGAIVAIGYLAKNSKRIDKYVVVTDMLKTVDPMSGSTATSPDLACWWSFVMDGAFKATAQKLKKYPSLFYYPSKTARGKTLTGPIKNMGNTVATVLKCQSTDNYYLDASELGKQITGVLRK